MKFKVAYTVDLKDVPNELNKILQKVKNTIAIEISDQIDFACREMLTKQNFSDAHMTIRDMREKLISLDHTLGDCMEGMTQYVEVYNSLVADAEVEEAGSTLGENKQEKNESE